MSELSLKISRFQFEFCILCIFIVWEYIGITMEIETEK